MRVFERLGRALVVLGVFALASYFALQFGTGGLWKGLESAHAVSAPGDPKAPYDLTSLSAVNETLRTIRDKYVEPGRVKPQQMFLSALNQVQKEVAQVIILHEERSPTVKVRVDTEEKEFRVDNVQGPWDVAARLREVFAFLQKNLKDTEVDLRDIEYAACNGMLRTLDPHSVFLSPESYKEMNLSTSGHFGGLGIVISIRDQQLTIMRPMPDTPAGRAGLKRLDRITKINNESSLNMPLDDAVKRLRGKPGSKVTIWVHRDGPDGWKGSRPFELTREEIKIRSVDSRSLGNGIGYVRIKQFQSSTTDELEAALSDLQKGERLKGLVVDLRGNPGGLLDQAAKVADKFLEGGVIVATVGASEGREEKRATPRGTEPGYPLVVLQNGSSASASEIVAGALKNSDRGVIVGQTSFGKGTVQLVFPRITADGAALKLTIAQYLTPGDISIQGTGIAPDVTLDPMTADTLEMDLFSEENPLRERDLSKSLTGGEKQALDRPFFKLRYNLPETERAKMRELGSDVEDEFTMDFPVSFSRDLASKLPPGRRLDALRATKGFLEKAQEQQIAANAADLQKLGVDWSPAPKDAKGPLPDQYEVKVETDRAGDRVTAGEPMNLKVTVKNTGTESVYQLRATSKSDSGYYDEKELVFGKLEPGKSKTASVPLGWCEIEGRKPGSTKPLAADAKRSCKIPLDAVTRQDVVKLAFSAGAGAPPKDRELRPTVQALPRPVFAYSYQIADTGPGNGDGQVSRGEAVTVYLTVKNVGTGKSYETQANLRNVTGDGLYLRAGRFELPSMAPGDVKDVAFTFDVLDRLTDNFAKVELSVSDRDLRVVSSEKVVIPIVRSGLHLNAGQGKVTVDQPVLVRPQPVASASAVVELAKGSVVERLATYGEFTKIKLDDQRFGFIETSKLKDAGGAAGKPGVRALFTHSPPLLDVKPAALATRDGKVKIEGLATDGDRVLDVFVFIGAHKVFYQSNRNGNEKTKLGFAFDTALQPGVNVVTVVARENEDTATRHTMVVRRDGPSGEALPTPKSDEFGADWEFGGGMHE